ncbi:TetR/AcrR family transcriptional regulator [Caenispirillum salinarum]|uniref:TetR/AcrR family transcriptional regulator n=1 Tax=Caenispirillum salinarum TaxID=859058 RepID=UPI000A02DECA|nr:TetR/AcrR family transcriptional regulator [Caenispirillum salinarum]
MSTSPAPSSDAKRPLRERVLDAAERVVSRDGAAHLTLDAVVAEAGVSKGGMLYHFRSKEALLQGLLARTLERHMARVADLRAALPANAAHGAGRAHLAACIERQPVEREFGLTLIAAAAHNPDLLAPGRTVLAETSAAVRDLEAEVPTARLLWLSMHGLHFLDILGISPLSDDEKTELRAQAHRILTKTGDPR